MFDLSIITKLLQQVGPVIRALPEFKATFDSIVSTFHEKDQATLRSTYEALQAENDAGFARLDAKLEAAKKL